jgi:hypothetical protein
MWITKTFHGKELFLADWNKFQEEWTGLGL